MSWLWCIWCWVVGHDWNVEIHVGRWPMVCRRCGKTRALRSR